MNRARRCAAVLMLLTACGSPSVVQDGAPAEVDGSAPDSGAGGADGGDLCPAAGCDDGVYCNGLEVCAGGACVPGTPPCSSAMCDEGTASCRCGPGEADADGDGHDSVACGGDDCDDASSGRFPGNLELCDSLDQDCDPLTLAADGDGDSFVSSACCNPNLEGTLVCGTDCDDRMRGVNPGATEACNGVDDDCNGLIDDEVELTFYRDVDADGYGRNDMVARGCSLLTGYAFNGGDCDDMSTAVNPGAADGPTLGCNELDDNCDGTADVGCGCTSGESRPCGPVGSSGDFLTVGICRTGTQTCIDGSWAGCVDAVYPETEDCEQPSIDDDCDGVANDGVDVECFVDADNDAYAPFDASVQRLCPSADPARVPFGRCPFGYTSRAPVDVSSTDCADTGPMANTINPVGRESCNALDDDCNGMVDDGAGAPLGCYLDDDGDGYAPTGASAMLLCVCPVRTTTRAPSATSFDCDDGNVNIHTGVAEICDAASVDENCVMGANEGCTCTPGAPRPCADPGVCAAGTQTCVGAGSSATWGACSITPVSEACDGRDEDCDGTADDGFACPRGDTRACTGSCGGVSYPGTQTCRSDCAGWGVCGGGEVCNGCDDDLDGSPDDGFACVRGSTQGCSTSCGTSGTQTCAGDCSGFGACRAATESCNFCDDVGDGGDDRGYTSTRTVNAACASVTLGSGASCSAENLHVANSSYAYDDMFGTFGSVRVGWGPVRLHATWSISDPYDVGGAPTDGLVMTITNNSSNVFLRRSVRLEWHFQSRRLELWEHGGSSPMWTAYNAPVVDDGDLYTYLDLELIYRPALDGAPQSLEAVFTDSGISTGPRTFAGSVFAPGATVYGQLQGVTDAAPFSAWAQLSAGQTYLRAESTCP